MELKLKDEMDEAKGEESKTCVQLLNNNNEYTR